MHKMVKDLGAGGEGGDKKLYGTHPFSSGKPVPAVSSHMTASEPEFGKKKAVKKKASPIRRSSSCPHIPSTATNNRCWCGSTEQPAACVCTFAKASLGLFHVEFYS